MLLPASSEFVALCRSQVRVIESLGAALSVVYLTEELVEDSEAKLIPIVIYPDPGGVQEENDTLALLPDKRDTVATIPWLLSAAPTDPSEAFDETVASESGSYEQEGDVNSLLQQRRIVLPLMHEGVVLGLLVTGRKDRAWNEWERTQIERIAHTMAIACILDQRRAWLEQRLTGQQRLQAQQNELLHNLLHQLRNPLTALRTFGKLLLKRLGLEDPNRDIASSIVRESDRMQELLQQFDPVLELTSSSNDIPLPLPAAELSSDRATEVQTAPQSSLTPKPLLLLPDAGLRGSTLESCSVAEVLEPLLTSAKAIAGERNLELKAEITADLPSVQANASALREVLSNLIDNALKYTPAGGKVYIQVGQERQTAEGQFLGISVSNTGPGIPPQDLEHLFERHYRGIQAETAIPGSGLGLAIARELVEQMQGKLQVISPAQYPDARETGVTFVVWLKVHS